MSIEKKYVTVLTKEQVTELIEHINSSDILAVDTETDSLNMRNGQIVGWSVSGQEGKGYYLPTMVWNSSTEVLEEVLIEGVGAHDITKKLLNMLHGKKLVFHNASFDIRFIHNFYKIDLIDSLWVDTGMLVHTVQEDGAFGYGNPFGLKSIAIMNQEELGLDIEKAANEEQINLKESIVENGGQITKANFEIYKADLDYLSEYAAADTDLTFRICNLYLKKLEEEGLEKFFFEDEVMPIYREVTIPMEGYGVDIDLDLLEKTNIEILEDLEANKKIVINSILNTSEGKSWVIDTALKNYPPSNKGNWAQLLCERYSVDLPKSEKSGKYSLTAKNIETMEDSPVKRFLQSGDIDHLEANEVLRISTNLWKESNDGEYINVQSKQQLGEIVFNYMGINAVSTTSKGTKKFDMDMLDNLSSEYTWAENLRVYNKLLKIKSTYIDRFLEGHENGRYYFYFKQNGTVSGRYGSDAQQLPKPKEDGEDVPIIVKYNNLVRAFIIAGNGRKFIDDDYSSLEPRIFAAVTQDEGLKDIYKNGWDFYSTIAIKTEKLDERRDLYPNGVSPDTSSPVFLKKIDAPKRNKAKGYSLGIPYGMESFALSKTLDIPQKEAQALLDGYLNGFPKLKQWRQDSREFVKKNGYITNMFGRKRHLPMVKKIFDKFGDQIMDWRFRKQLEERFDKEKIMKVYRDYRNGLNNCLNFQLQSAAASVVNRAALQINRKAKELGFDAQVVMQIHDQLVINVREDQAEAFAPIVQDLMENTTTLVDVDLIAEPEIANNLRDGH